MNKFLINIAIVLLTATSSLTMVAQTLEESASLLAKEKVEQLSKQLGLTDKQVGRLYPVLYANELNYKKHIDAKKESPAVAKSKRKFDQSYQEQLKLILSEKQLVLYQQLYPVKETK